MVQKGRHLLNLREDALRKRSEDQRSRRTRGCIKDAMLALLASCDFNELSVSELCREAGVTRSTFYRHFANLSEVVDELVDDCFETSRSGARSGGPGGMLDNTRRVAAMTEPDELRTHEGLLPACQRLANDDKYLPLLMDESLAEHVIRRIYQAEVENSVPLYMGRGGLTRQEAELMYLRDLYGTFFLNRALRWRKDDLWYRMHILATRATLCALDSVRGAPIVSHGAQIMPKRDKAHGRSLPSDIKLIEEDA